MVKKIWGSLIIMILSVNFLYAGVASQSSDDNRQFEKAFLDFDADNNPYEEYVYIKRGGIYFPKAFMDILANSDDNIIFDIRGKISIPKYFKGEKSFIRIKGNRRLLAGSTDYETYIANTKLSGDGTTSIVNVDNFGNKYIDFAIKGKCKPYYFKKEIIAYLKDYIFQIADTKKKRGQDYQWSDARIYVTE